jgi:hypothetical protein
MESEQRGVIMFIIINERSFALHMQKRSIPFHVSLNALFYRVKIKTYLIFQHNE